ncbi:LexA family transcriptional regulator [Bordetella genomosp. 9]|uniref:LexA family transcriptional regulator n=1 Tax=Bordetella genomosp. 9 TaxID=1416803 RepID=UPI001E46CECB|nr:helix-turn-helix transcriptional regulator [Bordetella genomosp. 9]
MFNDLVNATCINAPFTTGTIPGMKKMHPSTERLYQAARTAGRLTGEADEAAMARLLNVAQQNVHNWKSRGPSKEGLLAAQGAFGVNATWVKTGEGPMFVGAPIQREGAQTPALSLLPERMNKDSIFIPQFETGGAMGAGLELRDQPGVISSWRVSSEWLQKNVKGHSAARNLCIVTGFGDSMRPMFNPGDPLLVDTGVRTVDFDAVYFFRVENEGFIKRLQRIPGKGLTALSENKAYQEWVITPHMDFEVFGRVLKVWRSEDF